VKVGLVRGDSGFYTDEILSALEERSLNYIIAARAYSNLKHEVHGMKDVVRRPEASCSSRICPTTASACM
jgi:hypothetical protein